MESRKKYVRAKECAAMFGVSESTWWRWLAEGRLPKPIKIGPRVTCWRIEELEKRLAGKGAREND